NAKTAGVSRTTATPNNTFYDIFEQTNIRPARKTTSRGGCLGVGEEQVEPEQAEEMQCENQEAKESTETVLWEQRNVGHASKGGMTFIWKQTPSDQKKPCDYESITKNDGYLYDLEKATQSSGPGRQVDFILDTQPQTWIATSRQRYIMCGAVSVTCCLSVTVKRRDAKHSESKRRRSNQMQNNHGGGRPVHATTRSRTTTTSTPVSERTAQGRNFRVPQTLLLRKIQQRQTQLSNQKEEVTSILHGRSNLAGHETAETAQPMTERAPTEADLRKMSKKKTEQEENEAQRRRRRRSGIRWQTSSVNNQCHKNKRHRVNAILQQKRTILSSLKYYKAAKPRKINSGRRADTAGRPHGGDREAHDPAQYTDQTRIGCPQERTCCKNNRSP
ncbi:hypothetical protein BV898_18881, partial [Hypsibius exemplaris]